MGQVENPSLSEVLAGQGIIVQEIRGLPQGSLERNISSYQFEPFQEGWFIGYYFVDEFSEGNALPDHFWLVASDQGRTRAKRFRVSEFGLEGTLGSILRLDKAGEYLVVGGHSSPSAGPSAVIHLPELEARRSFQGWVLQALPSNKVVYHRSMIHWAPTHPARACLLNLDNGEEQEIYPLRPRSDLWRKRVAYLGEKYAEWGARLGNHHRDTNQFNLSVFGTWYDDISDTLVLQMFFGGTERCGLKYDDGLEHVLVLYRNLTTHPHSQEAPLLEMLARFDATTVEDLMNKPGKLPER